MIGPLGRVALYYAPAADDPLWNAATAWLGRDPATRTKREQPDLPGLPEITEDAGFYGFHGTLKPPFRLLPGVSWAELRDATRTVAASVPPFKLPTLEVTDLFGFLSLTEVEPSASLQAYADACVAGVDHLRAAPKAPELAARRRMGLATAEDANLTRWGYPYVFATWFFHMTLTRRLSEAEHALYRPAAEVHFAAALDEPRDVTDICLFVQQMPGAAFDMVDRIKLGG